MIVKGKITSETSEKYAKAGTNGNFNLHKSHFK